MTEYMLSLTPYTLMRTGTLKPRGDYLDTRSYLPGSVLRGALAEWIKLQGRAKDIIPVIRKIRFGNFFPSPSERIPALPFPITALECKLHGGFRTVPREEHNKAGHGIRDSLLIALAYSELERKGARFPVPMLLRCTHEQDGAKCGGRMERVGGFYARMPGGWKKVEVSKMLQTKVALSRYRRAAQEAMLYRVVGIRPRGVFVGRIWTDDGSVLPQLQQAVETIGVGALTSRGFGSAQLKEVPDRSLEPVSDRIQVFNKRLREIWHDLASLAAQVGGSFPQEPEGTYFSVDLVAPAILRDPQGIPTLRLSLLRNGQRLEPVFWTTQPDFIGGFSTAWGLPKPTHLGVAMGSVYVFRVDEPQDTLVSWLEELEAQGIGERADEGLGEIIICHPFHQEVMPV